MKRLAPYGALAAFAFCACLIMHGCATTPLSVAKDPSQKAFAAYGTFVVFEEAGASLIASPAISASVKSAIRIADSKAKPSADALLKAAQDYIAAEQQVAAGAANGQNALATATANLATWTTQAENDVQALVNAVTGAPAATAATTAH